MFKFFLFNSILFLIDSGIAGYLKTISFSFLMLIYVISLGDVVFFIYLKKKSPKIKKYNKSDEIIDHA